MFYPIKVYSGKELEDYTKKTGDVMSSKVKKNKKGKIISAKKLDKDYWDEFEKQEKVRQIEENLATQEQVLFNLAEDVEKLRIMIMPGNIILDAVLIHELL